MDFCFYLLEIVAKKAERSKNLEESNKLLKKYEKINSRSRDVKSVISRLRRKSNKDK